jgi:Protein of unknown function (DUF2441)
LRAPVELSVGSIIQPGNWGRIINLYEAQPGAGLPTNVFREALMEFARQIHNPTKPSRLACVFACPTLQGAIEFRNKHQKTNLIYEVKPLDPNMPSHLGDYGLAIAQYPPRYFQAMFDQARDYWIVPPAANQEVLLGCGVEIVSLADRPT